MDTSMAELTKEFIDRIKNRLTQRRDDLYAKLEEERSRQSSETLREIGGEVRDPGDESVAAERTDLENAFIERDVSELREIDAALGRIADGSYGTCPECGGDIEPARLEAYPTAKRCSRCQNVLEKQYANGGGATL